MLPTQSTPFAVDPSYTVRPQFKAGIWWSSNDGNSCKASLVKIPLIALCVIGTLVAGLVASMVTGALMPALITLGIGVGITALVTLACCLIKDEVFLCESCKSK